MVYLVTEFNFRDRQEETLAQKENVIRHLLVDGKEHGDSEDLAHKLDDFLVGHGDLSLEVARADGIVLYAHTRNQNAKTVWRQRQFEVAQTATRLPQRTCAFSCRWISKPTTSCCTDLLLPCWSQPSVGPSLYR